MAPARLAGEVLLVHETLNAKAQPRQAWVYNPGQRRVRRAPNVAYDNPGTASDGLRTNDMTDMFNGAHGPLRLDPGRQEGNVRPVQLATRRTATRPRSTT